MILMILLAPRVQNWKLRILQLDLAQTDIMCSFLLFCVDIHKGQPMVVDRMLNWKQRKQGAYQIPTRL